ncbi:uncharacterized protein LOC101747117 isoform X2 [Bombyx mori]|uniref:CHK kinase-like domain-containing protein n=1 Tax=Bombyx mori TaxID=7091 RepID=A0A8R2M3A2_BOMMO|nr:uncharacterized protein LOC101747117 isoform X2 [Bombyx mori]
MSPAEGVLRDLLRRLFPDEEPELDELTSGGANYTSALYGVRLPSRRLFAKVANIGEKMRAIMNAELLYSTEQYVYERLASAYGQLQRDHAVPSDECFVFPKYFGGNPVVGEETVLLEDLRDRGFTTPDRFASVDWEHARSAVTALARFHALSFACARELPQLHAEAVRRLTAAPREVQDEGAKLAMERMVRGAVEVVQDEQHKRKLMRAICLDDYNKEFTKFRSPLSVAVMTHGDYRPSNLLVRRVDQELETMVVDYQTVHAGCPAADLLYYVLLGTDEPFRRDHYRPLLRHYHDQLAMALRRLDIAVDDVYPWDTFQSELKQMVPPALLMAVVVLPLVTVEASLAPATDGDISKFALPTNSLFADRFNGVLRDCIAWAEL